MATLGAHAEFSANVNIANVNAQFDLSANVRIQSTFITAVKMFQIKNPTHDFISLENDIENWLTGLGITAFTDMKAVPVGSGWFLLILIWKAS